MSDQQISFWRRISEPLSQGYTPLWYGFVDESGDPAPFSSQPLVLVAVITQNVRELELLMQKEFKKTGSRLKGGELKASSLREDKVVKILEAIHRSSVVAFVVQVEKSVIVKPLDDNDTLYAEAVALLVRMCLQQHPRLELHLDKRYSNPYKQLWFERWIRDELIDLTGIPLVMMQEDSSSSRPLQIADFIAWAIGKKVRGDEMFWHIIEDKVIGFEVLRRERWD